ncbi:FecR domain-containing protein [Duganella sp. sic0402]|uniref:FecR domain-containing protein n=1 Tax=Duganella sp. sic0402 TaxID=2854786 RepID=UPI001E29EC3A|nr:FecR domain-containing protein [Duganella sp. sic0402]
MSASVSPKALEQAAEWLVRLQDGATSADRAACEAWRSSDPQHALAWERAERLLDKLGAVPPELAMPVLNRAPDNARRAAITRIVTLLLTVPAGWAGWRYAQSQPWAGDLHTAVGERRMVTLDDGTSVTLNTASAIDVRFTDAERLIVLRNGEILVRSSHAPDARPLRVRTGDGVMQPLGTLFNVRRHECSTSVSVLEGAVRITPASATSVALVIDAGGQSRFNARHIAPVRAADPARSAWTTGMLLADQMRLDELVAEIARYRKGLLRVDPAVAALRVSGAFPVADSERALDMLVSTYPVDAVQRLRGYWITLIPRD